MEVWAGHIQTHRDTVAGCTVSHRGTLGTGSQKGFLKKMGRAGGKAAIRIFAFCTFLGSLTFETSGPR